MELVSLMEDQEIIFGLLLAPLMKPVLARSTTVPVLILIKQTVPQLLQHSWGMITSVIQQVKDDFKMASSMVMILCGMELDVGL